MKNWGHLYPVDNPDYSRPFQQLPDYMDQTLIKSAATALLLVVKVIKKQALKTSSQEARR